MLELVLLLPTYTLFFFVVVTLGELGLVVSQVHQADRYAVWRNNAPVPTAADEIFFANNFHPRAKLGGASSLPYILPDGAISATNLSPFEVKTVSGAPVWQDDQLPEPLYNVAAGAVTVELANQGRGLNLGLASYTNATTVADKALNGDVSQTGGVEGIPWMRRRYVYGSVTYQPLNGIIPDVPLCTVYTLLRARSWATGGHRPYPATAANGQPLSAALRAIEATAANHQFEALDLPDNLYPLGP